jgi:hypothetical protein
MDKKLLFYGGIFGPIVFLLNDIIGGIVTPNYSYLEQSISDLTKAGTQDTYLLGSILLFIAAIMGIIFGIAIISHYKFKISKLIFLGGLFFIIIGLFNSLTGTIFPQDTIGGEVTFPGTMHLILVGIMVILSILALLMIGIGLYRERQWKSFRLYTFISVLVTIIFGGLSAYVIANDIGFIGLVERIPAYVIQLWTVVLAYKLITEYESVKIKG